VLPSKFVDDAQIGRPIPAVLPGSGTLADLFGRHGGGPAAACLSASTVGSTLLALFGHWRTGTLETAFDPVRVRGQVSQAAVVAGDREARVRLPGNDTGIAVERAER
jgi:hypothetical protein